MPSPSNSKDPSVSAESTVRGYYDDNTKLFLKFGAHGRTQGIHQPLYIEADDSMEKAMHAHHRMIAEVIAGAGEVNHVLDLGCGVGSSMFFLAQETPVTTHFTGLTLSPRQVQIGEKLLSDSRAGDRIKLISGSFQSIPPEIQSAEVAYAIESFLHSPDANTFFNQVANVLTTDGSLVIFDDFLSHLPEDETDRRLLLDLRSGYKALTLLLPEQVCAIASNCGLELTQDRDLSSYLRIMRPRDRILRIFAPLIRLGGNSNKYLAFLRGGNARQVAHQKGLLSYRCLVFRKL